jgi:type II secretory pathway component GspD/PulD (secretin)
LSPERQQDLAPIMRPIISTRKVTTKATIEDGSVLVCAGLMRQRRAQRTSKVPVLGDLPLLGILFRRDGSSDIRTNLMIFVKATILDGRGRRYSDALAPTVIGAGAAETGPDDAAAAEGTAVLAPDTAEPE